MLTKSANILKEKHFENPDILHVGAAEPHSYFVPCANETEAKSHNHELHKCEDTVFCIDYAQSGVGSNSCGPALAERHRLNEAHFTFEFRLSIE